jgi:hypothetical protein
MFGQEGKQFQTVGHTLHRAQENHAPKTRCEMQAPIRAQDTVQISHTGVLTRSKDNARLSVWMGVMTQVTQRVPHPGKAIPLCAALVLQENRNNVNGPFQARQCGRVAQTHPTLHNCVFQYFPLWFIQGHPKVGCTLHGKPDDIVDVAFAKRLQETTMCPGNVCIPSHPVDETIVAGPNGPFIGTGGGR